MEPVAPAVAAPETTTPAAPQPAAAKLPEAFGRPDRPQNLSYSAGGQTSAGPAVPDPLTGEVKSGGPSRNQPCPCGSGRKYKRCHGDPTRQA
jgi:preprotein translocase subunit SecA